MTSFRDIEPGDIIIRLMAETVEMRLKVTGIDEERDLILCGPQTDGWSFDRKTGVEVDDDLGWGPAFGVTGSRIVSFEKGESSG